MNSISKHRNFCKKKMRILLPCCDSNMEEKYGEKKRQSALIGSVAFPKKLCLCVLPNFLGDFLYQLHLRPLLFLCKLISDFAGSKSALWT